MRLRFESVPRPSLDALAPIARAQIEQYGHRLDGEAHPAETRLGARPAGGGKLYEPTWWRAIDDAGRPVLDLVFSDVDSGAVFRSGEVALVGLVIQFGFSATDLIAWEGLAAAVRPSGFPKVDFSIDDECGPTLEIVGRAGGPRVAIGGAWRGLRVVIAPWDPDGVVTRVITASSRDTLPGETGSTGAPIALFSAAVVERARAALDGVPADAVARRSVALTQALPDEGSRDEAWLTETLAALRAIVATGEPLRAQVI